MDSRVIFDDSARHKLFRVLAIEEGDDAGQLSLVTSEGVVWTKTSGQVLRRVQFAPGTAPLAPARRLRDGDGPYYAGFDFEGNRLAFFDADGRELASHSCKRRVASLSACRELVVAGLDGDGRQSLVVRSDDGASVMVFRSRGSAVTTLAATGHVTDVVAARLPGESADLLFFYTSPDPELERAVRVRSADGIERALWPIKAQGAVVAATAADGTPSIASVDGDCVVEYRRGGAPST